MDQPQQKQTAESTIVPGWISVLVMKPIPGLKGGLLIAAIYIAGYIVWSFNAWKNNLGFISLLDLRYFVAGLVPVVILMVAYFVGSYFKRLFLDLWPSLVGPEATGFWLIIRTVLLLFYWGAFYGMMFTIDPVLGMILFVGFITAILAEVGVLKQFFSITPYKALSGKQKALRILPLLLFLIAFLAYLFSGATVKEAIKTAIFGDKAETIQQIVNTTWWISLLLLPPMTDRLVSWMSKISRYLWVYGGVLIFISLGLVFYANDVYPNLPQAFGGPRPRCAYLDVIVDRISNETREAILPAGAPALKTQVVRSIQVDVFFSGSDFMLVSPSVVGLQDSHRPVYEISKSNVQAVTWCD